MDRKIIILAVILAFILVLVVGLKVFNGSKKEIIIDKTESKGKVKEFYMTAKNWEFEPSVIEANVGDRVILNIKSIDVDHGISLPIFGVNEFLKPGDDVRIEFVASESGEFSFFCNVLCGKGHSDMKGKLIVR